MSGDEHQRLHASKTPVSVGFLTRALDVVTTGLKRLLAECDGRIAELEARVKKLENQGGEAR